MNLIIDIGNTCAKLVAFDGDTPVEELRIDPGEWHLLDSFCCKYAFTQGILSTVATLYDEARQAISQLPFPLLRLESGVTPVPVRNTYKTPHTLGSDRIAAVVGAHYLQPDRDVLVIDIGTCITYDMVTADGTYLGGNISLGPTMRLKALNAFTSKLPLVERKGETLDLGNSTETAIRSGVTMGIAYEIEGYIRHFAAKHPQLLVYLTGGVHMDLHFSEKIPIFANDFIVPLGLNRILAYNNEIL